MKKLKNFVLWILLLPVISRTDGALPNSIGGNKPKIKWVADLRKGDFTSEFKFKEVSGLGFSSLVAGSGIFDAFQNRPEELRKILAVAGLKKWILYAGILPFDVTDKPETTKYLNKLAEFAGKTGAAYLMVTTEKRDSYPAGKAKLSKLALAIDAIAENAEKHGLKVLIGNSMHSICQTADELEFTLLMCKSRNTSLFLDLAWMAQSGTAPEILISKWGKKISGIHFNDLTRPVKGFAGSNERNYRLENPGKGNSLNYPQILLALQKAKYKGLGMISDVSADEKANPSTGIRSGMEWLKSAGFHF